MSTLDRIDDITPEFAPVFNDLTSRLWVMLGEKNPDDFTGVVTVQGGNFQIGLAPRAENLAALESLRKKGDKASKTQISETINLIRTARKVDHLRLMIVSPQAVLVLDVPRRTAALDVAESAV